MLTLQNQTLRCTIAPDLGAGIADFSLKGPGGYFFPLMRRASPGETNASHLGSFFMAPWVNRIRGGKFVFEGRERIVGVNTSDGMAQHGDVRKRAWTVVSQSATKAELRFENRGVADVNWPWAFSCRAEYGLSETGLSIVLSVRNEDRERMPAGCGHHPYFMRRLWDDGDELRVRVPVRARYPLEAGCAVGEPVEDALTRRLRAGTALREQVDAVFAADSGMENSAELHWPASGVRLAIRAPGQMGHWVVYSPQVREDRESPLAFVAVEPQTQVNDAMNLAARGVEGTGTVVLGPGEELRTECVFEVECQM